MCVLELLSTACPAPQVLRLMLILLAVTVHSTLVVAPQVQLLPSLQVAPRVLLLLSRLSPSQRERHPLLVVCSLAITGRSC